MSIHHTQIKKAANHGLELKETEAAGIHGFQAFFGKEVVASGSDVKDVIERGIRAVNGQHEARETAKKAKAEQDAELEAEAEERLPHTMAEQMGKYRSTYEDHRSCGDDFSQMMKGLVLTWDDENNREALDINKLTQIADQNDIDLDRWSHLNNGQKRMNLGNMLRGRLRRGDKIIFDGVERDAEFFGVEVKK